MVTFKDGNEIMYRCLVCNSVVLSRELDRDEMIVGRRGKTCLGSHSRGIAREECRKLYEKWLTGLEDELAALFKKFYEYTGRT